MNCRWIVAGPEIMEKLVVAKQAADLHSNELSQRIVHRFLCDNDVKAHIQLIRDAYRRQRDLTVGRGEVSFPAGRDLHGARRRDVPVGDASPRNVRHDLL